jgi:hypothetical protein
MGRREDVDDFQIAAERARLSYPDNQWNALRPSDQCAAIYLEMRLLDAEHAPTGSSGGEHVDDRPEHTRY